MTSEGRTAELTVGLWLGVPMTGFEPTRVDLTRFETLRYKRKRNGLGNHMYTMDVIDVESEGY